MLKGKILFCYPFLALACVVALTGCSIEQRLEKVSAEVRAYYGDAKEWDQLPLRTISWQQALAMVQQNNIELKKLTSSIERSERAGLSIYTDMIPGLSYYGYLSKTLSDVSSVSTGDINSNVNVTFNLPTITNIPYRVYAARANTYAAIQARELRERELTSRLYSHVRKRELELRRRKLDEMQPELDELKAMRARTAAQLADATHWKEVAEILGDYSSRWHILPESMPRIQWDDYLPRFEMLSPMSVSRFAIRLEQSRLAQYGIALQYLPTINAHLFSPSLFSSSGGTYEGAFLDGDDMQINLNASYTFDTQLTTWNSYMDRKEEFENARREIIAAIISHKHKLNQLKRSVQDYRSWCSYMHKRMAYLRETPVTTAEEQIARDTTLLDMQKELISQELAAIESETAVIIEYGLNAD